MTFVPRTPDPSCSICKGSVEPGFFCTGCFGRGPEPSCQRCGVPGESHDDVIGCADALIAYYAGETGRCSCGAPEPCSAPRYGGQHVPLEVWLRSELER